MNEAANIGDFRIDLAKVGGSLLNIPWEQSSEYFALASVGALVPGWSLIFPRKRALSFSTVLADDELQTFVRHIRGVIAQAYGPAWVFEHGSAECGSASGCGVDYAHLHIVPLGFDLCDAAQSFDPTLSWIEVDAVNLRQVVAGREYLLTSTTAENDGLQTVQVAFPPVATSQYFRRVIASVLGRSAEFDYKTNLQIETGLVGRRVLAQTSAERRVASQ